jgi:hypothetical protein
MKSSVVLVLGFAMIAGMTSWAQSKAEKVMPALVTNATWVQVRTMVGDQYAATATPEDRRAIAEVQKRIQNWGRYKLAYKEKDADIILVVRRGTSASIKPGSDHRGRHGPACVAYDRGGDGNGSLGGHDRGV